jgi:hypothetical protein
MEKFTKQKMLRIRKLKEQREEARKERQRLKALPKPLRKLETDLHYFVDFMEVYDGYIGDFTGQLIPAKPVDNPFVILNEMKLGLPHQNSIGDEQKEIYDFKISEAIDRLGFYIDFTKDAKPSEKYELLLFHIENPPDKYFDILTSEYFKGIALRVERIEFEDNC